MIFTHSYRVIDRVAARLAAATILAVCSLVGAVAAMPPEYGPLVRQTPGLLFYAADESSGPADDGARLPQMTVVGETTSIESASAALGPAIGLQGGHLRLPVLGTHDAVSVELWIRLTKPIDEIAAILAADSWKPGFLHLNARPGGVIELALNGASPYLNSAAGVLPVGRWTHLVATYNRQTGQQRLFRDGVLVIESTVLRAPRVNLVEGAIGAWIQENATRPLAAGIDEVAIYSIALTQAQARAHYLAGRGIELVPVDFANQVRPLLKRHCFDCHGPKKQESGLRLDVRDGALRGGESGEAAVTPFDAQASEMVRRIAGRDEGLRMPPEASPLTDAEVALLSNWIDQGAPWPDELAGRLPTETVTTTHWSFQPIPERTPPRVVDPFVASGNAIDAFIVERLLESGLRPAPMADSRSLVRRLYLDLHGLPPDPEAVRAFQVDSSPARWEQLVDRVLASPRYGERWASHWLDVIRWGETHGFEVNTPRDNAWPFRDWVIQSLNDDKPYDRFVKEQIIGDQLGADAATGFLVAAPALLPGQTGKDLASRRQARQDELHEVIVSVSAGVLGLTAGCARCHNHKFDPISQRDYYRLQAVFAGLKYGERSLRPADPSADAEAAAAQVFAGVFGQPEATYRLYRGDPMQRRERMAPDIPAVFGSLALESSATDADRRRSLADWLVNRANPLIARVIANRIWQHHFGTGLVATCSDFGTSGTAPTHPELLDWLAATLMDDEWSLKRLHRRILLSNTYRQSSKPDVRGLAVDAGSRLLWRYPPRRLEMEPIRDAVLATSGALDLTMGGPGFLVFKPNSNYVRVYEPKESWGPADWRRMIYAHRVRMAQDGVFGAFDCPDAGQPAPSRSRSTTAIQALNLLNSSFMHQQAEMFAQRAEREAGADRAAQIRRIFELGYARMPSAEEEADSLEVAAEAGLPAVCLAVLNSNEFLFLP